MIEELNTETTFNELIEKAEDIQSRCEDEIVKASDLHMEDDLKIKGLSFSQLAQSHLCGKLGIPGRYFFKMTAAKQNHLAAENVNIWLENDNRNFMFREYNGHVRGVLSESYSKYDAPDILNSMKDVFGNENFALKGSFISEERLHARLIENEKLPIEGEDLFAGIALDSSDVGRSALRTNFLVYKQVCSNGLKIMKTETQLFRHKHFGIASEEFKEGLEDGLKIFEELKGEVVNSIEETRKIPLPEDLDEMRDEIHKKTALSDDEITEVFVLLPKYGENRWGLINGITEIAQNYTLERRLQLEEVAGTMLA